MQNLLLLLHPFETYAVLRCTYLYKWTFPVLLITSCFVIGDCSRYVKVPQENECDAMSASSSQKSSDSSLSVGGQSVVHLVTSEKNIVVTLKQPWKVRDI